MNAISFKPSITSLEFNSAREQTAVEPLNKLVTYDPVAQLQRESLWKGVEVVSLVVSFLLTLASIFIVAAGGPNPAPLALIVLGVSLIAMVVFIVKIRISSYDFSGYKTSHFHSEMARHVNEIPNEDLASRLNSLGITPGIPPEKLKTAYARYLYDKELQAKANHRAKQLETKLNGIFRPDVYSKTQESAPSQKEDRIIQILRREQSEIENYTKMAAEANLQAAYVLKVLQSPYEKHELKDFVHDYSTSELATMDTKTLAHKVFELPKRWYFF